MRIDDWPFDRVMQMPDCIFGRRFLVSCNVQGGDGTAVWDIAEIALPEMFVVWEFQVWSDSVGADIASLRIAMGDQLPASAAQMTALEPLLPSLGRQGAGPRIMDMTLSGHFEFRNLKYPNKSSGRRLVLEVIGASGKTPRVTVGIVISSIPKEIPDWIILAPDKSLM